MSAVERGARLRHWPLVAALLLLFVVIGVLFPLTTRGTGGRLIYGLDDCYIHMAMAKTFSQSGVWGVTPHAFSASSSSPLWVLLLSAAYLLFGVNAAVPFVLNVLFAALVVVAFYRIMASQSPSPPPGYLFVALVFMLFAIELPALIFTGMEHTLQIFLVLTFADISTRLVAAGEDGGSPVALAWAMLLSALATAVRYESLGLVVVVCGLLLLGRRWKQAFAILASGTAPVLVVGIISKAHGAFWLPNPIKVKADFPGIGSLADIARFLLFSSDKLLRAAEILLLLALMLMLFLVDAHRRWKVRDYKRTLLVISLAAICLQTMFSYVGAAGRSMLFFRYEAYVVALGLVISWLHLFEYLPRQRSDVARAALPKYLAVLFVLLLVVRSFGANYGYAANIPQAAANVYEQQYQMGLFVKEFYQNGTVVLNDIGAVNYLADITCLDLVGLGSNDIMRVGARYARTMDGRFLMGGLTLDEIHDFSRNADLAILYNNWFPADLPPEWVKVGEWEIANNVACNLPVVSFFAVNGAKASELLGNLEQYSGKLPKSVIQRYLPHP